MKRWNYDDLIERLRNATALPMIQSLCNEAADEIEALVGAEKRKTEKDAPLTEYISREAAKEFIRSYRHSTDIAFHMEEHLSEIPAADVRPVVLCRDCMLRQYCKVAQYLGGDGFCSNGEKREESR